MQTQSNATIDGILIHASLVVANVASLTFMVGTVVAGGVLWSHCWVYLCVSHFYVYAEIFNNLFLST